MKEAQKEYGTQGRMKIIAVEVKVFDKDGRWTGRMKLVPKAVPWGYDRDATPWYQAERQIKSFWNWYHKEIEQWLSSEEAQRMWDESEYNAAEAKLRAVNAPFVQAMMQAQEFSDQISKITRKSQWLK